MPVGPVCQSELSPNPPFSETDLSQIPGKPSQKTLTDRVVSAGLYVFNKARGIVLAIFEPDSIGEVDRRQKIDLRQEMLDPRTYR